MKRNRIRYRDIITRNHVTSVRNWDVEYRQKQLQVTNLTKENEDKLILSQRHHLFDKHRQLSLQLRGRAYRNDTKVRVWHLVGRGSIS